MGASFIETVFAVADALTGKFIRIIGGRGMGKMYPSPGANLPSVGNQLADVASLTENGALLTAANVTGDQGVIRDDFNGSALTTALTGTLNFTTSVTTVTGSGTAFLTELSRDYYIKANAHAETTFTRVRRIISNTELELEQGYLGATASAAASSKTRWPTVTGSGGSFSVGSSSVTIASGTASGSRSYIARPVLAQNMHMVGNALNISQRIANQEALFGLIDNPASPTIQAVVVFDGTSNTVVKFRTSSSSAVADTEETTITLPFGLTTNLTTVDYRITLTPTSAVLTINGALVANHDAHIPEPYTTLQATLLIRNTAVVTTTNLVADAIYVTTFDKIQVANINRNEPIQIRSDEEVHYLFGVLTSTSQTADQVIVSTTVPTGKIAYLHSFTATLAGASALNTTLAVPLKIGKNTITTETASPGALDPNVCISIAFGGTTNNILVQSFATPLLLGQAGDVIKATVTPSANQTTLWRVTLGLIYRRT